MRIFREKRNTSRRSKRYPLTVEALEDRHLLDAALPVTIVNPVAQIGIGVPPAQPPAPLPFPSPTNFEQQAINAAVNQYQWFFDNGSRWYFPLCPLCVITCSDPLPAASALDVASSAASTPGYSQTNDQVQGVDEGDIVKTDGNYLYVLSGGKLVIIQAQPAGQMSIVSETQLDGSPIAMYLDGNRLTVISNDYGMRGDPYPMGGACFIGYPYGWSGTEITVFDVSDRTSPSTVAQTFLDGSYVTSRDISGSVYVVSNNSISFPSPYGGETEDQYVARISQDVDDWALPHYYTKDAKGDLQQRGTLADPTQIYQMWAGGQTLVSVSELSVTARHPELIASVGVLGSYPGTVYVSQNHLDLFETQWFSGTDGLWSPGSTETEIYQIHPEPQGSESNCNRRGAWRTSEPVLGRRHRDVSARGHPELGLWTGTV
jgi:hypothetical protein